MPTYRFNPHRHVKIWLSKDNNIFLNLKNQLRLVRLRELNPHDEISFLYERRLLSDTALQELQTFCIKHRIIAKDIQQDIIPFCETQEEQNLLTIYEEEIAHFHEGLGLSIPSDILRVLKPVYFLGTYSDFDVSIDTRRLPETITVNSPLLCNLGSIASLIKNYETPYFNWDIFAIVDETSAGPTLKKIQGALYNACIRQEANHSSYLNIIQKTEHAIRQRLSPVMATITILLYQQTPEVPLFILLHNLTLGKSSLELRQTIAAQTYDNIAFSRSALPNATGSDFEVIEQFATLKRQEIQAQLNWINWFFMPTIQYQSLKSLVAIDDNMTFITQLRLQIKHNLLKKSVVYTSGPGMAVGTLFPEIYYSPNEVEHHIAPYALHTYGLNHAFLSHNGLPMHATSKKIVAYFNQKQGENNDLSWLEEGQQKIQTQEQQMVHATIKIQGFFKQQKTLKKDTLPLELIALKQRIQTHIKKIQSDLAGYFGFYRHHQRQEKIKALQGMLTHFHDEYFDTPAFQSALPNYQSDNIFASLGKSETKALCDDLIRISKQAVTFSVSQPNGHVMFPEHPNHGHKATNQQVQLKP